MKLAVVTLNDPTDVQQWSGLNLYITRALERAGADVAGIGPLQPHWTLPMRVRQRWYDAIGSSYHAVFEPAALEAMGREARSRIPADAEAVLAVSTLVAAAIGPIALPLVSWDDANPAALDCYYPDFQRMAGVSRRHSAIVGTRASQAVSLAMYASEWAANAARSAYGLSEEQVAVVPFGANLACLPDAARVESAIAARGHDVCRLLWVGVEWKRKGGLLTLEIARALQAAGVTVELTLVGALPPHRKSLPNWVTCEGFVSKRTAEGEALLASLFARSHFFLMPSNAEAYGLVFVEAAANGVPSVALNTGGVPTIIVDGETGILEPVDANALTISRRILALWNDRPAYDRMCRASRARERFLLNWDVAGESALRRITELL